MAGNRVSRNWEGLHDFIYSIIQVHFEVGFSSSLFETLAVLHNKKYQGQLQTCSRYFLHLSFELTRKDWGTTSLPNACITASLRFRITSVTVLIVFLTPFLSPTKTHVHWLSEAIRRILVIKVAARGNINKHTIFSYVHNQGMGSMHLYLACIRYCVKVNLWLNMYKSRCTHSPQAESLGCGHHSHPVTV